MQTFICNIANYARAVNPTFIVVPQNGLELAFNGTDPENGLNMSFLSCIDGFGVEELFYNGTEGADQYRLDMLQQIKANETILVSEYLSDNTNIPDAIQKNESEGFLCFPRASNDYDYLYIPDSVYHENTNNITQLSQAQNYLCLISTDHYDTKESYLNAIKASNFDLLIIDLFFGDTPLTSDEVASLKTKTNGSKRLVISYISIGSAENYRYYWKKAWHVHCPNWLKRKYDGYPDEFWVKFWKKEWQDIIFGNDDSYMKKIIEAGFDGAYLDNVEAYYSLYFND